MQAMKPSSFLRTTSPIVPVERLSSMRSSLEPDHFSNWFSLQNQAAALLAASLALDSLQEGSTSGSLEDFTDTLIGAGRALKVLVGTDLLADFLTLETH
jgi:hypothetical protein